MLSKGENIMESMNGIVYYGGRELLQSDPVVSRPLNVVFLTSIRDTGTDDRNGTMVETGNGVRYMEGIIERTVRETHPWWRDLSGLFCAGMLADIVRVVGVITDDMEKDMRLSSYSVLPEPGRDWIYPLTLSTHDGQLVRDMTYNIPSSFRGLARGAKGQRRQGKYEFEVRVLQKTRELEGDILISDHYMARLDHLYKEPSLYGCVLNIHPAVTIKGHPSCLPGKAPMAEAIARARHDIPTRVGATLHFINERIDEGPPIAYVADTPVFATDERQWLRYRNYTGAKLPLFIQGLAYYVRSIYPYLDKLDDDDLNRLQPILTKEITEDNERAHAYENILLS